jgi:hypothetical protein
LLSPDFADVPTWNGQRLEAAETQEEFDFYARWLANYLFRPAAGDTPMEMTEARREMVSIEMEMAEEVWFRPVEADHAPRIGPRHADYLFRDKISRILSRIPAERDRVALLTWLYQEYQRDSYK